MINPKSTTQCIVMQQCNVSHNTVGIVPSGYAKPGGRDSILYSKSLSVQHTNFVNITFITVSESKYKTSLAGNHY